MNIANGQSVIEMPLYEGNIPNSISSAIKEKTIIVDGTRRILNVIKPTLTKYLPTNANGLSVIICPGGGYARLTIDKEGVFVAQAFNKIGITAFVLKYRLPNDTIMIDKSIGPLQDVQQAIRMVRNNAEKWGIKKNKIGIMGFSAGGHLAATAMTHYNVSADTSNTDTTSLRPDFTILIYPVISFNDSIMHKGSREKLLGTKPSTKKIKDLSNELQITEKMPPVFLIHSGDDPTVPVENSLRFYEACIKNKVPAEMHLYPKGGHGFGLNNKTTNDNWFERLDNWLKLLQ